MGSSVVVPFGTRHLAGVIALCEAQAWPSLPADPERAERILTDAEGSSFVAVDGEDVIGFAFAIVDAGALDAYLSMLVVAASHRRQGIARRLIDAVFRDTAVVRINLLAEPGSEQFYDSFPNRTFAGYRIYPDTR